jgi:hypothetical protein
MCLTQSSLTKTFDLAEEQGAFVSVSQEPAGRDDTPARAGCPAAAQPVRPGGMPSSRTARCARAGAAVKQPAAHAV